MSDSKILIKVPIPPLYMAKVNGYREGGEFYDQQGLCDWEVNGNFVDLHKAYDELRAWTTEVESRLMKLEEHS
jgi:hypothetical protein